MAEVLLFHHAQGQTEGFKAFADELRRGGHTVRAPDLFDGRTFASIEEGVAYASPTLVVSDALNRRPPVAEASEASGARSARGPAAIA